MNDTSQHTSGKSSQPRPSRGRQILKWSGITLGALIVLVIIAIVVIPHIVNLGPIKHEIEHVASQRTGRQVTISGPLSLSLFPWVGFGARDVTMANVPGFGDKPFLQVREADIHVQLIPLIFHDIKVSGITLKHMSLNLERKPSGADNWSGLAGSSKSGTGAHAKKSTGGTNLGNLSIGRIALNDLALNYDDARANRHYTLSGMNLKASNIASGQAFPLEFRAVFNSREPHVNVSVDLNTQVEYDATLEHIDLGRGTLDTTISGAGLSHSIDSRAQWHQLAVNLQHQTANIKSLQVSAAGATMRLDATASDVKKHPSVQGHLRVDPFSPRKLLATLGNPVPGNLQGFNKASLETDLAYGGNSIALNHFDLKLDGSTLHGRISVPDLNKRSLRFDLTLDSIDLNHYLPAGSGPAQHAATQHSQRFMETRLPGRLLSKLDMSGQLRVGHLSGFGLAASQVSFRLDAHQGTVKLAPLAADLYGGHYGGTITVARAGQGIKLDTRQKLRGIEAGKLITALGGGSRLSGTADASLVMQGQGDTVAELLDTLKGQASFAIEHGALDGINLWDSLERAYALVKDHKRLPASGPKRTEFANFKAHASIAHGIITNDALETDLPFVSITGRGRVNLVKHRLDYDLLAKVVKTPKTARANLSQLKGLTVPIHLSGDFMNMTSAPDIRRALEARAKAEVRKKLEKQKQSVRDKLKNKLQDVLGGGGGR